MEAHCDHHLLQEELGSCSCDWYFLFAKGKSAAVSVYDCVVLEDHNLMYVYIPLEIYTRSLAMYVQTHVCSDVHVCM